MWKTEKICTDENTNIWIRGKKAFAEKYQIVVEVKAKDSILVHYPTETVFVDVDRKDK